MSIEIQINKRLGTSTAMRVLARVQSELVPSHESTRWGSPPYDTSLFVVKDQLEAICEEERKRSTRGMMHGSFFSVRLHLESNQVKVYKLNQKKDDELFFTLTKKSGNE